MLEALSYSTVIEGLENVEKKLRAVPDLDNYFLRELMDHVLDAPGKRMRPTITLISADFHRHEESVIETMAAAVELLHIATLIHDDTVDESDIRHGQATVGNLWGGKSAVLVGDYLFATSATLVCDTSNVRVIRRFSETIMELASGELQEMSEAYRVDQTREKYFKRIYNKTASLFTTAGESGAILSGSPEEFVKALRDYSYNLGMAFQIVDDILDFIATESDIGKPVGNDLSRGILTLPSIIAMENYPNGNPICDFLQNPKEYTHLEIAVDLIQNSSAIEESYACVERYCNQALKSIGCLPKGPARTALEELTHYFIVRNK